MARSMRSHTRLAIDQGKRADTRKTARFRLFELLITSILGALIFAAKVAMAALPNIEPVTLLLVLSTLCFGASAFISCGIYIVLEGLFYGFSTWWIPYLYAWPLLVLLTLLFRRRKSPFFWAIFSAVYGFLFGFMFLPVNYFVYGMANNPELVTLYILNDIPFNALHAVGNFVTVLFLLPPLCKGLNAALSRISHH